MTRARDVLAALRLEDGRAWGDAVADFQLGDALAVLEGSRPYTFATRPRGGSKTTDAGGVALAWLLTAPPGARGFWAAADREQAALGLDTIRGFIERSPALQGQVEVQAHKVIASSGASVETLPADAASSWGLRPELLIVDEFAWWGDTPAPRQFWESISSAVAKSSTARMLVITSPSDPAHFSHGVLAEARSSELWTVSEQVGLVPWLDPARVGEQERRLPEAMYRRLFLGEWCEGEETLAPAADVDACIAHSGPLDPVSGTRYAMGADLGVRKDRTAIAVAHLDAERRVVVDRVSVWKGSRLRPVSLNEVEEWIEQASRSYNGAELACDPWQAISMIERLRGKGVKAEEFTFSSASTSKLAGTMVDLLRGRRLALPDDPEFIAELRAVRLVERSPGQFRIDHASGQHDDQVIAVALAAQHLLREPEYGSPETGPNPFDVPSWWQGGHVPRGDPRHDDHRRTVAWMRRHNRGYGCEECVAEAVAREARQKARDEAPPEVERRGRFLIEKPNQRRTR